MSRLRRAVRRFVERNAPTLALAYRRVRDDLTLARTPRPTPHGFSLVGPREMMDGTFEPDETRLIQELLGNADRFIDVGAHVGYYTCLARNGNKPVVAFEPMSSNLRYLMRNLQANRYDDVEVWPVGLSDHPGLLPLYGSATSASMVQGWDNSSAAVSEIIPVSTLDTVLRGRFEGERLVIKIDVEGAEYDVVKGAADTALRTPKPVWLIEIVYNIRWPKRNENVHRTFDFFWSKGYTARAAGGDRKVVTPEDVARWTSDASSELPVYNWVFSAP